MNAIVGNRAPTTAISTVTNRILPIAIGLAVAGVLILRIVRNLDLPLGLDETFTAIITGQSDWSSFVREARRDLAAPLYYLLLWPMPGESNFALRLPSFLFMLAAAMLAWRWRIPSHADGSRMLWAGLLLLWLPGAQFAFDARPYALLFLTATAQTIAFARLLDAPDRRRAFIWTGCAALSLLTHYMAGALGLAQGLVLLIVLRRRALGLWPALIPLALPAWDLVDHLPLLRRFQGSAANWLPIVGPDNVDTYLLYGIGSFAPTLIIIAVASRILDRTEPMARTALLAGAASALATVMLVVAGWDRPFLVDRYLIAGVPGILLALATVAAGLGGRLLLLAAYTGIAVFGELSTKIEDMVIPMQRGADFLIPSRPERLVYSLGYTGQRTLAPETTKALGEFYFRRAGLPTEARIIDTIDGWELVRRAGEDAAILWVHNARRFDVGKAIARTRPCYNAPSQLACPALRDLRKAVVPPVPHGRPNGR